MKETSLDSLFSNTSQNVSSTNPLTNPLPSASLLPSTNPLPSASLLPSTNPLPSASLLPSTNPLPSANLLPSSNSLPHDAIPNNMSLIPSPTFNFSDNVLDVREEAEETGVAEHRNPTIHINGYDIDIDSMVVILINIILWILFWFFSGIYVLIGRDLLSTILFFGFIVYMICNIIISGNTSGNVMYELNILMSVEQMVAILFGAIVLFTMFIPHFQTISSECRSVVQRIAVLILIVLTLASLWINLWTNGRAFRMVRKLKQGLYNLALCLFLMICIILSRGQCMYLT